MRQRDHMASISQDTAMGTLILEMGDSLRTVDNKYQILLLKTIFKRKNLSKVERSEIPDLRAIFNQIVNNVRDKESASNVVKLMKDSRFKFKLGDLVRLRL